MPHKSDSPASEVKNKLVELLQNLSDSAAGEPQATLARLAEHLEEQKTFDAHPETHCRALILQAKLLSQTSSEAIGEDYLLRALALSEDHNLPLLRSQILIALGMMASAFNDFILAEKQLSMALESARTNQQDHIIAEAHSCLATVQNKLGDYHKAIQFGLDALQNYRELNNIGGQAAALNTIALIYHDLREFDSAIEYAEQALNLCKKVKELAGAFLSNFILGKCRLHNRNLDKAIGHFSAAAGYSGTGAETKRALIQAYLAYAHAKNSSATPALKYLEIAQTAAGVLTNSSDKHEWNYYCARTYFQLKQFDAALEILQRLVSPAAAEVSPLATHETQQLMADTLKSLGKVNEAQYYQRLAARLREEQRSLQVVREIYSVTTRRELLEKEFRAKTHRQHVGSGSSSVASSGGGAGAGHLRRRLEETLRSHVRSSEVLNASRSELLKLLPELDAGAVRIAKTTLGKIDNGLETLQHSPLPDGFLEEQHHDLVNSLRKNCPQITPAELRICVLLQLRFRSKEIAQMLACSAETVSTHRRNIRKKLNLPGGANLTKYLETLPQLQIETHSEPTGSP